MMGEIRELHLNFSELLLKPLISLWPQKFCGDVPVSAVCQWHQSSLVEILRTDSRSKSQT